VVGGMNVRVVSRLEERHSSYRMAVDREAVGYRE
jgi:hypothetical protein